MTDSTCYTAEPVNVLDVDARETSFLPDADSDVLIIIIICCIIGWALRLLFLAYALREFVLAKATGRLSVHSDVPLHSYIVPLDINARLRFLGYLRARTPAAPTAEVVAYTNPVELRRVCLTLDSESAGSGGEGEDVASTPHLSISFDCMLPATLQVFWGLHDISSPPPPAIEMAPLPPVRTNRGFSGRSAVSVGADRGAAGGGGAASAPSAPSAPSTASAASAARDGGAPSHILSSSLYMYASDAVAVSAGRGHTIKLGPEALPSHADLEATLRSPCLLVFSGFGEPPPPSAGLPKPLVLRSTGAHVAAASAAPTEAENANAAASAAAGSAATESAPDSAVLSSGSYLGTVEQLLLGTADGFLEVAEVFGFQSVGDGEDQRLCVACMAEPKDTIVLPCRHLCVCSSCFDQLTNERCPVCRTLFTSFLRIDPSLNTFSKQWDVL
eukprot:jgi/Chrpa1/6408/Chrysochromulina_OHIO_Genome00015362-RA